MIHIAGRYYEESYHFATGRAYRIQEIEARIGYGEALCVVPKDDKRDYILTDTGILFVVGREYQQVLTAYIPTLNQAERIIKQSEMKMPKWFAKVIIRNQKWAIE